MCTSQHHSHLVSTAWGSPDDQPTQPPHPDPRSRLRSVDEARPRHGREAQAEGAIEMNRIDSSIRQHVTVEFFKEDEFVELALCMHDGDESNETVRSVTLSPTDARALADALNEAADEAESE